MEVFRRGRGILFNIGAIDKVAIRQNTRTGAWEKRGGLFAGFSGFILPTMPYLRNSKLLLMVAAGIVLAASAPFPTGAQQQAADINGREVLEQALTQTYQLSIVGKGMMGVGSATAIRRAGTSAELITRWKNSSDGFATPQRADDATNCTGSESSSSIGSIAMGWLPARPIR